ncbi:transcriptional regulator [Butyricimonas virosa]|uniref:winged helix-turn-helix domain-containing protein n=1 Tax=Butyricimonas virosa TaxID=544645 RepID=UPI00242ED4BC|nr:winged helix-turn-helix domain-containing protein [Butyricimonas virosa]
MAGILTINDKIVRLKPYDSRLLHLLCVKFGELADEDYLIEGLWGMADSNKGGSLRRCINHLRKILADDIEIMIKNQYSRGYTLATLKLDSLL